MFVAAATACGPVPVTFTVPLETETVVEGQGLLGGVLGNLGLAGFDGFDLSSSQEFENNNTEKDRVQEVYLTSLSLSATEPDGARLDFIETITFFASAPGEERVQVATGTVADGATSVDLDVGDVNLAPYVRAESMTLDTELTASAPPEDTTVRAEALFEVTAEVDGSVLSSL